MHKAAKRIVEWRLVNRIDTVVVGRNKGWKQNAEIGKKENPKFVQIPFGKFQMIMKYLCE